MYKKSQLLLVLFFLSVSSIFSQEWTTADPTLPSADEPVTIYFNSTGTPLEGYTGKVYTHTGITINGEEWQNVIGDWGNDGNQPEMINIETNLYKLEITTSVREFYDASITDDITKMNFVYRGEGGSPQTADDIYPVYKTELSVLITNPTTNPLIVEQNDLIEVRGSSVFADSNFVYVNDVQVYADTGADFSVDLIASEFGQTWVVAEARNETGSVTDSFYYYVRGDVVVEELPEGVADGITYTSNSSAILSLYAPDKEFVFAWGDYNNWELSDDVYMKQTPDMKRFWIELTNLEPKKQYVFQYFIDGDVRVGDMYCEQVSDPWNDHYISSSTYPDLPEYPEGKTVWMASVLQTDQDKYTWKNTDFTPPKKEDLVVYELLVRDFVEAHDYNTLIDTLDYLERMGINAIELMPTNEFEGNLSWGYNPNYYFAADKYYGHRNTMKAFIDECHGRGIAVIADLVLNHSYGTSPFVMMYWDAENNRPAANNPWYNEQSNFLNPDAQWGYDFNHESLETQRLVDSINSYWMSEYMIDGFRFDFTKGFSNNIKGNDDPWGSKYDADRIRLLERMSDEIWKRNPEAFVIFEHLSDNNEEKELANYGILMWGNLNHAYSEGTMGYTDNGKSDIGWISYQRRQWNDPNVVGYMESHDEERLQFKNVTYGNSNGDYDTSDSLTGLQRQALAANFFFTIPGPKMIWQFGERGYDYSIDYNGRVGEKPPRWDYLEDWNRRSLLYTYTSLIDLKIEEDVFETREFDLDVRNAMKKVRLTSPEMSVIVLGNFNVVEGEIIPNFYHTGTWYDFWTGDSIEVTEVSAPIALIAGEYRLYTDKKLEAPDFVGVDENIAPGSVSDFVVYPNPATDQVNLKMHMRESSNVQIELFDMQGRMVKQIFDGAQPAGLRHISTGLSDLNQGLYFVVIRADGQRLTKKLLIN